MAELVIIGYANEAEAQEVMDVLRGLERDLVIQTAGSAVVASGNPLFARMSDLGVPDEFRQQVTLLLRPGCAAVALLFVRATPDRTLDALAPFGGMVLKTPLSGEAEQLREALSAGSSAVAPA